MTPTHPKDAAKNISNLTALVTAGLLVVSGIALLVWSALLGPDCPVWIPSLMGQLGGLLVATGIVTTFWELAGKRAFADEVLSKAKLQSDVVRSGLDRVTDRYLTDVEWEQLFAASHSLDIVVAYGSTWRNENHGRIEKLLSRKNGKLRVFLPDPSDTLTMQILADRFNTKPAELQTKVNDAIKDFRLFGQKGEVEIYVRTGDAVFSCYQFDHKAVMSLYSHSKKRRSSVPTFLIGGGFLRDFIRTDIEEIENQSRKL